MVERERQYIQNQLKTIEESINSNNFGDNWNYLHKKKTSWEAAIQNGDTWKNHFEQLYSEIYKIFFLWKTQKSENMIHMEHTIGKYQNPLDYPITENELIDKIQALKNKKASGPDGILNEMLKNTENKLRLALLKVFNLVISLKPGTEDS